MQPRACHPRDLLDHVQDVARYRAAGEPTISDELLDYAGRSYFLNMTTAA